MAGWCGRCGVLLGVLAVLAHTFFFHSYLSLSAWCRRCAAGGAAVAPYLFALGGGIVVCTFYVHYVYRYVVIAFLSLSLSLSVSLNVSLIY